MRFKIWQGRRGISLAEMAAFRVRRRTREKSAGQNPPLLGCAGGFGEEGRVFGVAFNIVRDEGAARDDGEMLGAGEFEGGLRETSAEAVAFERVRDFGVLEDDAVGKADVDEEGGEAVDGNFEVMQGFVVGYRGRFGVGWHGWFGD